MNALRPFPRPVEVAFPPNATVIAVRTALLPPTPQVKEYHAPSTSATYFRCDLYERHRRRYERRMAMLRTNDKVNLWAKFEGEELMAHELVHLDGFNNAEFCCTLLEGSLRIKR